MSAKAMAIVILVMGEDYNVLLTTKQIRRINKRLRKITGGEYIITQSPKNWWLVTV